MNLYFLVEGRRTEAKVYPAWLSYLIPELKRVDSPDQVNSKNYFLISGEGYPSLIYNHIPKSIEDVNDNGKYDYLVVCLDAEEVSAQDRAAEVNDFLEEEEVALKNTQLILIIQNRCIETWLLGNRRIYVRNPQAPSLVEYTQYYNVLRDDPELMGKHHFNNYAKFHLAYLKSIFVERNIAYTKRNPGHVLEQSYLNQLWARINEEPKHLPTFRHFIDFCRMVRATLTPK